jgi:hypothetical protein
VHFVIDYQDYQDYEIAKWTRWIRIQQLADNNIKLDLKVLKVQTREKELQICIKTSQDHS